MGKPNSYILMDGELYVLLMLFGVEQFYGLQTEMDLSERHVSEILFSLTRKEYLKPFGDVFEMKEHLKEILISMIQAERILIAYNEKNDSICIYLGEHIVSLEKQWGMVDAFRIGIHDDWMQVLSDKGYLLEELIADDLLFNDEETQPDSDWKQEEYKSKITILMPDGSPVAENKLYKRPLNDLIVVTKGEEEQCYHYSERLFRQLVDKEI